MENEQIIEEQVQETQVQESPVFSATVFGQESPSQPHVETVVEQANEAVVENQEQVNAEQQEEGVSSFSIPSYGEEEAAPENVEATQTAAQVDWKEAIKKMDRREVLKELGLKDFTIDFAEYYENGNDPYKYLEAKAFDWNKVNDIDILKQDYKLQYPTFEENQIERLIAKKYGFIEGGDDEDNADALLLAKADAHVLREKKIQEQKSFVIPSVEGKQVANQTQPNIEQLIAEQQQVAAQEYQKVVQFYNEHEATQNLAQSKRVGVDLGLDKPFYFNVDKPEMVTKAITNGEFWQRITAANPQEVDASKLIPDVNKLQKIVLHAMNPNYEKDIFNYGKSFGLKTVIEEGQNAKKPSGTSPSVSHDSPNSAWGRAEVKTFGRN